MSSIEFRAVVVETDGAVREVEWDSDGGVLRELQEAVGGYVDVVALDQGLDMWVNDEGLVNGMSVNWLASALAARSGAQQPYWGPAVFTGGADEEGKTLSLPAASVASLVQTLTQLDAGGVRDG